MTGATGRRVWGTALVLVVLSGCTAGQGLAPSPNPSVASPAPQPITELYDLAAGTVLGTGTFDASTKVPISGSVEISTDSGRLTLSVLNLDLGPTENTVTLELNALTHDASTGRFRTARSYVADTPVLTEDRQTFDIASGNGYGDQLITNDPSWMRTAVLWEQVEGLTFGRVLATAKLAWTMPDLHPDLKVLDTGEVPTARGSVIYDSAGNPSGYVVVPLDALETIADRFSITMADLLWLNPMRGWDEAQADETLNLSRYERGR